jgi:hypothetical protein
MTWEDADEGADSNMKSRVLFKGNEKGKQRVLVDLTDTATVLSSAFKPIVRVDRLSCGVRCGVDPPGLNASSRRNDGKKAVREIYYEAPASISWLCVMTSCVVYL